MVGSPQIPILMLRFHGEQAGPSARAVEASEGGLTLAAHSCAVTCLLRARWGGTETGRHSQATWGRDVF